MTVINRKVRISLEEITDHQTTELTDKPVKTDQQHGEWQLVLSRHFKALNNCGYCLNPLYMKWFVYVSFTKIKEDLNLIKLLHQVANFHLKMKTSGITCCLIFPRIESYKLIRNEPSKGLETVVRQSAFVIEQDENLPPILELPQGMFPDGMLPSIENPIYKPRFYDYGKPSTSITSVATPTRTLTECETVGCQTDFPDALEFEGFKIVASRDYETNHEEKIALLKQTMIRLKEELKIFTECTQAQEEASCQTDESTFTSGALKHNHSSVDKNSEEDSKTSKKTSKSWLQNFLPFCIKNPKSS